MDSHITILAPADLRNNMLEEVKAWVMEQEKRKLSRRKITTL